MAEKQKAESVYSELLCGSPRVIAGRDFPFWYVISLFTINKQGIITYLYGRSIIFKKFLYISRETMDFMYMIFLPLFDGKGGSSHLASPHLTSSHLTSPRLASPRLASSHLTSPAISLLLGLHCFLKCFLHRSPHVQPIHTSLTYP